jgi:hypothetical protein
MNEPKIDIEKLNLADGFTLKYRGMAWENGGNATMYGYYYENQGEIFRNSGRPGAMLCHHYWEIVKVDKDFNQLTLEEKIKAAQALVKNDPEYKDWKVLILAVADHHNPVIVLEYYEEQQKPIVIFKNKKNGMEKPFTAKVYDKPSKPSKVKVVLNSQYTAEVSKDSIVVGCQTFPIEILDELIEARNKLKN